MQNQQIDLKQQSTEALKAMIYDISKSIVNYQNAIKAIEGELELRLQNPPANGKAEPAEAIAENQAASQTASGKKVPK